MTSILRLKRYERPSFEIISAAKFHRMKQLLFYSSYPIRQPGLFQQDYAENISKNSNFKRFWCSNEGRSEIDCPYSLHGADKKCYNVLVKIRQKFNHSFFMLRVEKGSYTVRYAGRGVVVNKNISTFYVSMVNGKTELKVYPTTSDVLTSRETQILSLLVNGMKRPQIAESLSISAYTVDTHMKHIHSKMTAHSDVELISKALKDGIV
jgi:DNA-binding CsgD family transcriptional regulator